MMDKRERESFVQAMALFANERRLACYQVLSEVYPDWASSEEIAKRLRAPVREATRSLAALVDAGYAASAQRGAQVRYRAVSNRLLAVLTPFFEDLHDATTADAPSAGAAAPSIKKAGSTRKN